MHHSFARSFLRTWLWFWLTSLAVGTPLSAQLSTIIQRPPPSDAATAMAAWAKSDTGRMAPGYRDLSRYRSPGMCLAAMTRVHRMGWTSGRADTGVSMSDTLLTSARKIGKTCIASMTPQNVLPLELPTLMRVAAALGDTAVVRNVVDSYLASTNDSIRRALMLKDAIDALLDADPAYMQVAKELQARLISLGVGTAPIAVLSYIPFQREAWNRFDTTAWLRLSQERETLNATIPRKERERPLGFGTALGKVYLDSVRIVEFQRVPNLVETVGRLFEKGMVEYPSERAAATRTQAMKAAAIIGTPLADLPGVAGFPDTITPEMIAGKVTLLIYVDKSSETFSEFVVGTNIARYHRLYQRYHDQGFQVVLLFRTRAGFASSQPLAPLDEARAIGWWVREQLGLPFWVIVQGAPSRRLPDGRRVFDRPNFEMQYQLKGIQASGVLVGRDGKVMHLRFDQLPEAAMDAWVRLALKGTTP